jgi:ABC-type lipoprotein export system ATPase subunit
MSRVDVVVKCAVPDSARVRQLEGMFDVPPVKHSVKEWHGEIPLDEEDWNVGLIVGPSGIGKSVLLRELFGGEKEYEWGKQSVVDDFASEHSLEAIAAVCQAVGFNTIPAWLRPFSVLSVGEQFRVRLARMLLEGTSPLVCDEFTSVVDRQVAQIGSHAVQKYVRKHGLKFVAASCHYDIIDWLQPDWILEPATMTFTRRSLQQRPQLSAEITRVRYEAWHLFAPYHYLTAELHPAARCYCLFVNGTPAAFAGMLHVPHPRVRDIQGCSRLVTLPDWQGFGLAFALIDNVAAGMKSIGKRVHTFPAHPALIRSFDRSPKWAMVRRPGTSAFAAHGPNRRIKQTRQCATFEYVGEAKPENVAMLGF